MTPADMRELAAQDFASAHAMLQTVRKILAHGVSHSFEGVRWALAAARGSRQIAKDWQRCARDEEEYRRRTAIQTHPAAMGSSDVLAPLRGVVS